MKNQKQQSKHGTGGRSMLEGMDPVFERITQLCQTNLLTIDKIAKENNMSQYIIARLFVLIMEYILDEEKENK